MNRERPPAPNEHHLALGHAIDRAKLVILWERVWPRLVLFLGIFGGVLAVSWLGFWQVVPYWARFGGVLFVLALLLVAAWPLLTIRRPSDQEALRRIDRATDGGHRPATALADGLATSDDPFAKALWEEHRARVAAAAGRLRTGIPMPRMPSLDRYAIRALALLLIVPAFFLAGEERTQRLLTAFDWRAPPVPVNYRIDAWVTPPPYTARPPVILPTRRAGEGRSRRQRRRRAGNVPCAGRLGRHPARRRPRRPRGEAGGRRRRRAGAGTRRGRPGYARPDLRQPRGNPAGPSRRTAPSRSAAPAPRRSPGGSRPFPTAPPPSPSSARRRPTSATSSCSPTRSRTTTA
jgi:hypothetical protein